MFTLKDLCTCYREHSKDPVQCCNYRANFLIANKDNDINYRIDESDIKGLRPYLLCDILATYEYIDSMAGSKKPERFSGYEDKKCKVEDTDEYGILVSGGFDEAGAREIIEMQLASSIEPFKSRGIPCKEFDYTV